MTGGELQHHTEDEINTDHQASQSNTILVA